MEHLSSSRVRATASSLVLAALTVGASACSVEDALDVPSCEEGGTAILAAQSVPSGSFVPCFDPLPAGWNADTVTIDQDGTVIHFDSDRAGDSAAVFHYTDSCDIGPAVWAPSDYSGTDRYDDVERVYPSIRGQRYYLFDGGCIWWDVDFADDAPAALAIELGDRLKLLEREVVDEMLRETFIDEGL